MSQCQGTTLAGSRCRRPAVEDSDYCPAHEGESAPAPIAEGEDAPHDLSDEDTSVPDPEEDAPAEEIVLRNEDGDEISGDEEVPTTSEPERVPNPAVPEGTATTFNVNEPPPEPSDTPEFPHEGRPQQYMVIRTNNSGWVIEEKWQYLPSFDAIEEVIQSEVAAGRSGSLHRGNQIVATWGPHGPARV